MHNKKHETFCDYDLTNLLTKSGFDWKDYFVAHDINEHFHWEIPLHIAQKWLRETQGIEVYIIPFRTNYKFIICYIGEIESDIKYTTYEDALEAGIKKALEIILEKEDM